MRQHRIPASAVRPGRFCGIGSFVAILLLTFACTASAQYMYLDANGDGINTAADKMNDSGATRLAVYLDTARDRNGSPVSCNSHTGEPFSVPAIDIFAYIVTLKVGGAPGSAVTWGAWGDSVGFTDVFVGEQRTDQAFVVSRFAGRGATLPPGLYKLGTIDVTVAVGAPSIRVSNGVATFVDNFTGFGTDCDGSVNANTYTLGIDWFDTDGVGPPSTVTVPYPARVFTTGPNRTFRLFAGKPTLCVRIEPSEGSFDVGDVQGSTISLASEGTGIVGQILAIAGKATLVGDQDRDGIQDIEACFARADLELLFSGVRGRRTVSATAEGLLSSGRIFRGAVDLEVVGGAAVSSAFLAPNPLNPEATLRFTTEISGPLRVRVFDVGGRLLRELLSESFAAAGEHAIRIDGRGRDGAPLASGVYFYRIESGTGATTGRFAILR